MTTDAQAVRSVLESEIESLRQEAAVYRQTLEAIAGMKVDEDTDLPQLVALMKATAKTGLATA